MGQILSLTTFQDMPKHVTAVEKLQPSPTSRSRHFHWTEAMTFASSILEKGLGIFPDTPKQTSSFLRNFDEQTSLWVAICQGRKLSEDDYSVRGDLEFQFKYSGTRCTRSTQSFLCNRVFAKDWYYDISDLTYFSETLVKDYICSP